MTVFCVNLKYALLQVNYRFPKTKRNMKKTDFISSLNYILRT